MQNDNPALAIAHFSRAASYAGSLGKNDVHLATSLQSMGDAFLQEKEFARASSCFSRAEEIWKSQLNWNEDAPVAGDSCRRLNLENLGGTLFGLGKCSLELRNFSEAESKLKQAVDCFSRCLKLSSDIGMNNLAGQKLVECHVLLAEVYANMGKSGDFPHKERLIEAEKESLKSALALADKVGYPFFRTERVKENLLDTMQRNSPEVALPTFAAEQKCQVCMTRAEQCWREHQWKEASEQFKKAVEAASSLPAPGRIKPSLRYAESLIKQNKYKDAQEVCRKAFLQLEAATALGSGGRTFSIDGKSFDHEADHLLDRWSQSAQESGDYKTSAGVLEKQLELRARLYGRSSMPQAQTLSSLAIVHEMLGQRHKSMRYAGLALTIYTSSTDNETSTIARIEKLADLLYRQNDFEHSKQLYSHIAAVCRGKKPEASQEPAALFRLSALEYNGGRHQESAEKFKRASKLAESLRGAHRVHLSAVLRRIAAEYAASGDQSESRKFSNAADKLASDFPAPGSSSQR